MKLLKFFSEKIPKKKVLFVCSLILFTLLICLISVEVFSVLLIKKMGWNYEPAYLRILKGYTSSNLVGGRTEYHPWGQWNVPNYEGRVANNCFDVKYKFNSYGARDKERSISGQNRTLVLGDSFVEGWGVDQDKILAAHLERISGKEFLNFGIAEGFGVLNEYILYRDLASKYEHDSVMVGFLPGNDFLDNDPNAWAELTKIYYRPFWKLSDDKKDVGAVYYAKHIEGKYLAGLEPANKSAHFKIYSSWREFSALLNLIAVLENTKYSLSKDGQGAKQFAYKLDVPEDAITASLLVYDKFSKLIGDKKKYILVMPSATDVFYYVNNGRPKIPKFEEFKKNLGSQGWEVIDLIDVFANVPENEIPGYFICDGHWNGKGNKLVAEYLHKLTIKQ